VSDVIDRAEQVEAEIEMIGCAPHRNEIETERCERFMQC
jgi:hypothetical protein